MKLEVIAISDSPMKWDAAVFWIWSTGGIMPNDHQLAFLRGGSAIMLASELVSDAPCWNDPMYASLNRSRDNPYPIIARDGSFKVFWISDHNTAWGVNHALISGIPFHALSIKVYDPG